MSAADPHTSEWTSRTIPVSEDMSFQRRFWRIQRWAWIVMGLVLVAALLGLFSSGPLSRATTESVDGRLQVEFERFLRNGARAMWKVRLPGRGAETSLLVGADIVNAVTIESIQPEPIRSSGGPDGINMTFDASAGEDTLTVHISARTQRAGRVDSTFATADSRVSVTQFVYP